MRPLLGTFVEIGFAPVPGDQSAVQAAFAVIEEVQRRLSFQDPESELSALNRCRCEFLALSSLTVRVLRLARAMTVASGGLFNCTLGGALVRRGVLPDHGHGEMLDVGTAADIEIRGRKVRLTRPVRLTLDGIAKGYAVDLAVHTLRREGVRSGWVNAGGDLRVFGPLTLPVHRREADGALRLLGGLHEAAIASSLVRDGTDRRFPGTILRTGGDRMARRMCSVLSRQAWRADALTKVAALAPDWQRPALLNRLGGRLLEPGP
jgi:thiamine biosynthesis lipoprotein